LPAGSHFQNAVCFLRKACVSFVPLGLSGCPDSLDVRLEYPPEMDFPVFDSGRERYRVLYSAWGTI
jgi:hypothetical protein